MAVGCYARSAIPEAFELIAQRFQLTFVSGKVFVYVLYVGPYAAVNCATKEDLPYQPSKYAGVKPFVHHSETPNRKVPRSNAATRSQGLSPVER